ncbi:MAG: D-alanine--D-alanine ligase [Peptococcaceae bacterium]|nr:D-alanine--D-alanine ligase [Peptococcaceae bacterium]
MNKRTRILLVFGGQSGEHEVSIISAGSIFKALDSAKYEVETVGITKEGLWYWGVKPQEWQEKTGQILPHYKQVTLLLDPKEPRFIALDGSPLSGDGRCDIVFPVLHGPKGEDGTIQGLFDLAGLPYVGSGVLGSALGMDKGKMKAAFRDAGLPIVPHLTFLRSELKEIEPMTEKISKVIGYPCFVKPANLGSSVGISKAENEEELWVALALAAEFDRKIIVEKGVKAREIELSVLGNDNPQVSIPGEIIPSKEFYDYEAKYIDTGSKIIIPAALKASVVSKLQEYARRAFLAVEAKGLGRIDFFVTEEDQIYVNEINTMPGFTQISMYPKLWEASGLPYPTLLDQLIELGWARFEDERNRRLS